MTAKQPASQPANIELEPEQQQEMFQAYKNCMKIQGSFKGRAAIQCPHCNFISYARLTNWSVLACQNCKAEVSRKEFTITKNKIERPLSEGQFLEILNSFFCITLDPFVFGDLKKPDGGKWNSSQDAFEHWLRTENLTDRHGNIIFHAVDTVAPYT